MKIVCLFAREAGLNCLRDILNCPERFEVAQLFTHRLEPKSEDPAQPERREYVGFETMAKQNGFPICSIDTRRDAEQLEDLLKKITFDVLLSLSWRYRVLPGALKEAKIANINLHRGRLPDYKGARPVLRAIQNQDQTVLITAHRMVEEIDAGETLATYSLPLKRRMGESDARMTERIKKELTPHYGGVFFSSLHKILRRTPDV